MIMILIITVIKVVLIIKENTEGIGFKIFTPIDNYDNDINNNSNKSSINNNKNSIDDDDDDDDDQ